MGYPYFLKCCYIRFRLLRYRLYPWITLANTPLKLLTASGVNRTREKIRCMSAMSNIDFAGVYGLSNDLLW